MSGSIIDTLHIFSIVELLIAITLHSTGLYLLLTMRRTKVMIPLLAHLSLIELSCACLQVVEEMYNYIKGVHFMEWKTLLSISVVPLTAQFLTLMAITLERGLAVMLPLSFRNVVTKKRLVLVLISIWLVSLSMAPIVLFTSHKSFSIIMLFWVP